MKDADTHFLALSLNSKDIRFRARADSGEGGEDFIIMALDSISERQTVR